MKQWCTVLLMWLGMVALSLIALSTLIEAGAPSAGPAAVKPTAKSFVPDSLQHERTKTCCPSTRKLCRR